MKIQKVTCKSGKPEPIVVGVEGGGYVSVYTMSDSSPIGTIEFLNNPTDVSSYVYLRQAPILYQEKIYLNEGEALYGLGSTSSPAYYNVVYYNQEPTSQTQTPPINLTGTIQLNQQ